MDWVIDTTSNGWFWVGVFFGYLVIHWIEKKLKE